MSVASIGSFVLYLSSAVACYAALGNGVPGEVLEGFEDAPDWCAGGASGRADRG